MNYTEDDFQNEMALDAREEIELERSHKLEAGEVFAREREMNQ